jgi:hypothetical protein
VSTGRALIAEREIRLSAGELRQRFCLTLPTISLNISTFNFPVYPDNSKKASEGSTSRGVQEPSPQRYNRRDLRS